MPFWDGNSMKSRKLEEKMKTRPILPFWLILSGFGLLLSPTTSAQTPYPCKGPNCATVAANGWIVGEIRSMAFGGDSQDVVNQLAARGWVECAGQSLIRKDFDLLWRVTGSEWGAADSKNVFYLPDLRGLFLRGWQHDRSAPDKYQTAPYTGDPTFGTRMFPRPEAKDAGGSGGPADSGGNVIPNHVGTLEPDLVGPHTHPYPDNSTSMGIQPAYDQHVRTYSVQGADVPRTTGQNTGTETHPSNAYVMYLIYVGAPAQVIAPTPEDAAKGITGKVIRLKIRKTVP